MRHFILVAAGWAAGLLNVLAQPVIVSQPVNQLVVWGSNATFSVMVTGVGPFTYQWQMNGTNLPNNIINTVAGGNLFDGQAATNAVLNTPQSSAIDLAGNLYIADMNNHVVRKVGTNGVAKIIAGVGVLGFRGDGGQATNALLNQPAGVAVDTNGNIFIADSSNNRIRKVDTNGIITTVAGNGSTLSSSSIATNTGLYYPFSVAVNSSGSVFYIADTLNHNVWKVDAAGTITKVAGTGTAGSGITTQLNSPYGVAVDSAGNVFIADSGNHRIRKVTTLGSISTVAGTGTAGFSGDSGSAVSAMLNSPNAVSVETNGNLYIADTYNHRIRKITNNIISTVAGNGTSGFSGDGGNSISASLASPIGVTVDRAGNLFIADLSQRIRMAGTNGLINTVAGKALAEGEPVASSTFNMPTSVAQDAVGNRYVSDYANHRIRKIDTNGLISTFAGNGFPGFSGDGGPATNAGLYFPNAVALGADGNVFISDEVNRRIRKVDTNGIITTVAGKGTIAYSGDGGAATNAGLNPRSLAVDSTGSLLIADGSAYRIRKVGTNGIISTVAGNGSFSYSGDNGPATSAGIGSPESVTADSAGNVYISSPFTFRIRKVGTNGIITTVAGKGIFGDSGDGGPATNAQVKYIARLACDDAGQIYLSDGTAARIRKFNTNGIITTIAGNGTAGVPAENLPANNCNLSSPRGLLVDKNGILQIADLGANRLRKISYLDYANQPSFIVTNANLSASSNAYSVIITSASGSVTSSVAAISLQLPPVTPIFAANSNTIAFTWSTISNLNYQLQCATNLSAPVWVDLGTPIAATNSTVSVWDVPGIDPARFYRVQLVP